eukprot:c20303_g1_i2.p1 GENE.c20303_g1_i2~~c20303_g1_i2.p1  ORF type:complete len:624 (+),score=133.22 c20303_g1_i2:255-1874(+)
MTPLMWAASTPTVSVVNELLRLGADLEAQDGMGFTALTHACSKGEVHAMHTLLQAGANVMVQDHQRHTLLDWAVYKGQPGSLDYILRFYPNRFSMLNQDSIERTAVHWGCRTGQMDCIRMLASSNSDEFYAALNIGDDEGALPLSLARNNDHHRVVAWVEAITEQRKPIPHHPLKQRWLLLTSRESLKDWAKVFISGILFFILGGAILPVGVVLPIALILGNIVTSRLRDPKRNDGGVPRMSLYFPAIWMAVNVSGCISIILLFTLYGFERTPFLTVTALAGITTFVLFIKLASSDPGLILGSKAEMEEVIRIMIENDGEPKHEIDPKTMTFNVPRSHYASLLGCRVARYDHFCIWLQLPVGYKNHTEFMYFMVIHIVSQLLHMVVVYRVVRETDALHLDLLWRHKAVTMVVGYMGFNLLALGATVMTLVIHVEMMFNNWTSHERGHASRLWYFSHPRLHPFNRGVRGNLSEFCSMGSKTAGGYADIHLKVPEATAMLNHHGHSHAGGKCGGSETENAPLVGSITEFRTIHKKMRTMEV